LLTFAFHYVISINRRQLNDHDYDSISCAKIDQTFLVEN